MPKVAHFPGAKIAPKTLLAMVAEQKRLQAVVVVVKRAGAWEVSWSGGLDNGGLSMAAVKLLHDVQWAIHAGDDAS